MGQKPNKICTRACSLCICQTGVRSALAFHWSNPTWTVAQPMRRKEYISKKKQGWKALQSRRAEGALRAPCRHQ
eukprot:2569707-Prymnesium_polylepis.1